MRRAAVAVASALGEDEIPVAIGVKSGASVSAEAIAARWRARRAAIKVPRCVAFVEALPTPATERVRTFQRRAGKTLLNRTARGRAFSIRSGFDQCPGVTMWTWARLTLINGAFSTCRPPSMAS